MPTIVEKSIGIGGAGAGRDYSTLQAWEDACPADLVAADQVWKGVCYNDGEFVHTVGDFGSLLNFGGTTVDATRYYWLTVATGHSIFDNINNPLRYDPAKGVGLRRGGVNSNAAPFGHLINNATQHVRIERLQLEYSYSSNPAQYTSAIRQDAGGTRTSQCFISIVNTGSTNTRYILGIFHYGGSIDSCVVINKFFGNEIDPRIIWASNGTPIKHCTLIGRDNANITTIESRYGANIFTNCAIFGCNQLTGGGPTASSSSSYNITDGPFAIPGTNNKTARFLDCFNSYQDLRPKKDSPLTYGGVYDSTYNIDPYGVVRTPGMVSIGAIQYVDSIKRTLITKREPEISLIKSDLTKDLVIGLIPRITASTSSGTVAFNAYYNIVNPAYIGSWVHGGNTAPIVRGTPEGPAIISSADTVSGAFGTYSENNSSCTLLTVFMMPSAITNNRVLATTRNGGGGWDTIALGVGNGTSSILKSTAVTNSGTSGIAFNGANNDIYSNYILSPKIINCVACSYSSSTGHNLAANGQIVGSNAPSGNFVAGANHLNITGGVYLGNSGTIHVYMVLWWNRALSQRELIEVTANPWKLVSSPNVTAPNVTKYIPSEYTTIKKVPVDFENIFTKGNNYPPQNTPNIRTLNNSIVGIWNFNNLLRSDISNTQKVSSSTGTFSLEPVRSITGLRFNGSSRFIVNRTPGYVPHPYSKHSILVVITPKSVSSQQGIICLGEVTDSNYTSAILIDSTGRVAWGAGYSSGGIFNFGGNALEVDKTYSILFISEGINLRRLYINGRLIGTDISSVTQSGSSGGLGFGDYWLNGSARNQYFNGILHSAVIFNKSLNDSEAISISANPWQLFTNPSATKHFLPSTLNRSPIKVKRDILSEQPQEITEIDWSNPLTSKLVSSLELTSGSIKDFASTLRFNHTRPIIGSSKGLVASFSTAGISTGVTAINGQNLFATSTNPFSVMVLYKLTTNTGGGTIFARCSASTDQTLRTFQILYNFTAPGRVVGANIRGGSVNAPAGFAYGTEGNRDWHLYTVSFNGGTSADEFFDTFTQSMPVGSAPEETTELIRIGSRASDTGLPMTGQVAFVRIWSRALSRAEHLKLYENPWQIFKSKPQIYLQSPLQREIGKPIPMLKDPPYRTSQPRVPVGVNWANPITKDLKILVNAPIGINEVNSRRCSTYGVSTNFITRGARGSNFLSPRDSWARIYSRDITAEISTDEYTLTNLSGDKGTLLVFGCMHNYVAGQIDLVRVQDNADNVFISLGEASNNAINIRGGADINLGGGTSPRVYIGVADGTTLFGYRSGSLIGSATITARNFANVSSLRHSPWGYVNGSIIISAFWNRALTAAEVKSLSDNPWQLFETLPEPYLASTTPITVSAIQAIIARRRIMLIS